MVILLGLHYSVGRATGVYTRGLGGKSKLKLSVAPHPFPRSQLAVSASIARGGRGRDANSAAGVRFFKKSKKILNSPTPVAGIY